MEEKISIVIPVYNVEQYLKKCINSVMEQTYKNLEIILVDDGSTDKSGIICDEYAQKDDRIKVLHKVNGGVSTARNAGLEIVTGTYIGFIDPDDYIKDDMYEVLLRNMKQYDAEISICRYQKIFKNKGKLEKNKNKIINVEVNTSEQAIRRLLETKEEITDHVWNKLYKKEIFDGIKYTIIREFEDIATMYKLFEKSKKIVYTNYEGYYYVQRDNSLTANVDIKSIQNELYAVKSRYEYLKEKYSFLEEILMQNRAQYALIYHTSCAKVGAKNIFNEKYMKEEYERYKEYVKRYSIRDILKINTITYKFFAILLYYTDRKFFYYFCNILYNFKFKNK